jgi:negative regulator of flagellin synthesis FlgM
MGWITTMAINPISGIYSPPVRGGYVERPSPSSAGSLPDKPISEVDKVQLTPGSMSLRQMETERQEPPVDETKVAALRKAIANGEYRADAGRIARKMSDFEEALFS